MDNTAIDTLETEPVHEDLEQPDEADVIELQPKVDPGEPLQDDCANAIEAWARHALAANGFGDA